MWKTVRHDVRQQQIDKQNYSTPYRCKCGGHPLNLFKTYNLVLVWFYYPMINFEISD